MKHNAPLSDITSMRRKYPLPIKGERSGELVFTGRFGTAAKGPKRVLTCEFHCGYCGSICVLPWTRVRMDRQSSCGCMLGKSRVPPSERFWKSVNKGDFTVQECWVWRLGTDKDGYGKFSVDGLTVRAHVYAWEISNNAKVPKGKMILHRCDNPPCVNPSHLLPGTARDNIQDCIRKGRWTPRKLDSKMVNKIRGMSRMGVTGLGISRGVGVHRTTVYGILNNKLYRDVPYLE